MEGGINKGSEDRYQDGSKDGSDDSLLLGKKLGIVWF
jgi:hypothetical protein